MLVSINHSPLFLLDLLRFLPHPQQHAETRLDDRVQDSDCLLFIFHEQSCHHRSCAAACARLAWRLQGARASGRGGH